MLARGISFSLVISQTPVLIGFVAFVIWGITERLMHILQLHQPKAPQAERLSLYSCGLSWYGAVIFSLLDAIVLHWTTISRPSFTYPYTPNSQQVMGTKKTDDHQGHQF